MQAVCTWNISNELSLPAHLQSRLLLWTCFVCACVWLGGVHGSNDNNKTWHLYGVVSFQSVSL